MVISISIGIIISIKPTKEIKSSINQNLNSGINVQNQNLITKIIRNPEISKIKQDRIWIRHLQILSFKFKRSKQKKGVQEEEDLRNPSFLLSFSFIIIVSFDFELKYL